MKKDFSIMSSWAIRYFVLFFVFFLFPAFIFFVARNYEDRAAGIVIPEAASSTAIAASVVTEESRVLSQEEATTLQGINESIDGDWLSQEDIQYVLRIKQGNTFDEIFKGKKFGWGSWRAFSGKKASIDADTSSVGTSSFAEGQEEAIPTDYYLQRIQLDPESKGEKYLYRIYQLSDDNLVLIRTDNGKVLPFVRSTSLVVSTSTEPKQPAR